MGFIKGDKYIRYWLAIMFIVSLVAVASASTPVSIRSHGNSLSVVVKHLIYWAIALGAIYALSKAPAGAYNMLYNTAEILVIISIFLLILTNLYGVEVNGAKRWLKISNGITLQTADLFKFSIITLAAKYLSNARDDIKELNKAIKYSAVFLAIGLFFILREDLSTAALIVILYLAMFFIGNIPYKYFAAILGSVVVLGAIILVLAYTVPNKGRLGTWHNRIENFISGGDGYQATVAKAAIAEGGLIRFAPGQSKIKNLLPQASSDFIYSIIVEEYGLIGGVFIIFLYLGFGWRSMRILKRVKRSFAMYLVAGYSMLIVVQAFMHILVNVGLMPVTGQPLPFISKGGTFLVVSGFMVGIILNISRTYDAKESSDSKNLNEDPLINNVILMD